MPRPLQVLGSGIPVKPYREQKVRRVVSIHRVHVELGGDDGPGQIHFCVCFFRRTDFFYNGQAVEQLCFRTVF
jgi:hypothetical protein